MLPINTLNGVELGMEWGKEDHLRSKYFHSLLQQCFAALEVFLHLKNVDQLVLLLSWIFNLMNSEYGLYVHIVYDSCMSFQSRHYYALLINV